MAVEVAVLDPLGGACAPMTQCEVQRVCARERAACDGPHQAGRGRVLGGYQQPPRVSRDEGLCVGTTLTSSVSALCERSGAASVLWRCALGQRDERRLRARMSDSNNARFA